MLPNVPNITSCAKIAGGSSVVKPTFPTIPGFGTTSGIIIGQGDITGSKKATCDNRRWYGSKELTTDHGLNTYDFEARWLAPAFPRFTTPDPLSTDYHPISPYAYCGANPINLIDPTGMDWIVNNESGMIIWVDNIQSAEDVPEGNAKLYTGLTKLSAGLGSTTSQVAGNNAITFNFINR